ncbi:MAG: hypothetical protein AAF957_00305 [Planctomycetota bacterium]
MSTSRAEDARRQSTGSTRSLSQRFRSTSSPEALERTRRNTATRRPSSTISHNDILDRYRRGDTVGKRMGSTRGSNGHASKLPMLSDKRTSSREAGARTVSRPPADPNVASVPPLALEPESPTRPQSNSDRITALRRSAAARMAAAGERPASNDEARIRAARENAAVANTDARVTAARQQAADDSRNARIQAARQKAADEATETRVREAREGLAADADRRAAEQERIRQARKSYDQRVQDARAKTVGNDGKNGVAGGPGVLEPNGTPQGGTTNVGRPGDYAVAAGGYGYYNDCYWDTWGSCSLNPWCGWFCGPIYCTGWWWHSYWWCGGRWSFPCYWYGPFIPARRSVIVYQEPQVIYIEQPVEEEPVEEYVEEGPVAPVTGVPPEATDPDLERELNRAAAYYLTQGDRAFRETRYGDAAHFYAKAVEFSPDTAILYLVLSDALFATGDYRYAAYALRQALSRDPSLASNVIDKRDFYADPADFERQLATLERFVEDHVLDMDARLVLAANYLFGGQPEAALELLQDPFSEELRGSDEGSVLHEVSWRIVTGVTDEVEEPVETGPEAAAEPERAH